MISKIIKKTKGTLINKSLNIQIFFLVLIILISLLIFNFIGMYFGNMFFDIGNIKSINLTEKLNNEKFIDLLKSIQIVNAIGTFIIPTVIFYHLKGDNLKKGIKLNNNIKFYDILKLFLLSIIMIPIANAFGYLNSKIILPDFLYFIENIENQTILLTEKFLEMKSLLDLIQMIFIIGITASICEEFLFRGVIQNLLIEKLNSVHYSILISAIIFSIFHLQFSAILPRFILGIIIGYVYLNYKNLIHPILLHFFYNSTLVILSFLGQKEFFSNNIEEIGTETNYSILIFIVISLMILYQNYRKVIK
tara:strand:- start:11179 stop:12096 length:918 start_codon:yes stop_codon:yes gene_type:complete